MSWGAGQLLTLGPNFSLRLRTAVQQHGRAECHPPDALGQPLAPILVFFRGEGALGPSALASPEQGPGAGRAWPSSLSLLLWVLC